MKLCFFFSALWQVVVFWHCITLAVQAVLVKERSCPCMGCPFAPEQLGLGEALCPAARRTGLCL